jgi:predicted GNAT family N-acyltransferase
MAEAVAQLTPNLEVLDQILDLRWRVLYEPHGLLRGSERDQYDDIESYPETIYGFAKTSGLVVASGRMHQLEDEPSTLQLAHMAVEPQFQGRGLGGKLLHTMEDRARQEFPDAEKILLGARQKAQNFYTRAGFTALAGTEYEGPVSGLPHIKMYKML